MSMDETKISFATLNRQALHPQHGIPQLYHDQLNVIAQHLYDMRQIKNKNENIIFETDEFTLESPLDMERIINKVKQKHNMFTLQQLLKRDDWEKWNESIFKQLDQYHAQDTFGEPERLPKGANLLSLCWIYLIKTGCGTYKARCVCNGSPRFRGTVTLAETFASALAQTGARCFWVASSINNFIIIGADASNAFAEAPPPVALLYVRIDSNYK